MSISSFLDSKAFIIFTKEDGEYFAWAYRGPLDFEEASPIAFGRGKSPGDALDALEYYLKIHDKKPDRGYILNPIY